MRLTRENPLREFQDREHELDKFWQKGWGLLPTLTETAPMDMYEEHGSLTVEVALPNFKKNEVLVTASDGVLEISAEHKERAIGDKKRHYFLHESSNQYLRRVPLPAGTKFNKAKASFRDSVLRVTIPGATSEKATKVSVK